MVKLIAVPGGGVKKGADGVWRSVGFDDNIYGAPGSILRVIAANYLFKNNENSAILVLGGKGQMKDISDAPTLAEVLKRELVELGVPEGKTIEEKESGATYQQLSALQKIAEKFSPAEILLISNRYHLPRVRAMLEFAPELKEFAEKFKARVESAEEIVLKYEPEKWKEEIERAYASPEMRKLIAKENEGARQTREGRYKFS